MRNTAPFSAGFPRLIFVRAQRSARHQLHAQRQSLVVTTLTNPVRYPADEIAKLYLRRWSVELFFRDIKITLGMDVLRCQTPDMVRKEIIMHAINYNLIRALMQQAASLYHVPIERLSFKGTADTLRQWADPLNAATDKPRELARLINQLLRILAEDIVPLRPKRAEPRIRKQRPRVHFVRQAHKLGLQEMGLLFVAAQKSHLSTAWLKRQSGTFSHRYLQIAAELSSVNSARV